MKWFIQNDGAVVIIGHETSHLSFSRPKKLLCDKMNKIKHPDQTEDNKNLLLSVPFKFKKYNKKRINVTGVTAELTGSKPRQNNKRDDHCNKSDFIVSELLPSEVVALTI